MSQELVAVKCDFNLDLYHIPVCIKFCYTTLQYASYKEVFNVRGCIVWFRSSLCDTSIELVTLDLLEAFHWKCQGRGH